MTARRQRHCEITYRGLRTTKRTLQRGHRSVVAGRNRVDKRNSHGKDPRSFFSSSCGMTCAEPKARSPACLRFRIRSRTRTLRKQVCQMNERANRLLPADLAVLAHVHDLMVRRRSFADFHRAGEFPTLWYKRSRYGDGTDPHQTTHRSTDLYRVAAAGRRDTTHRSPAAAPKLRIRPGCSSPAREGLTAWSRLAATRPAKDSPGRSRTGKPAHRASLAVVWAL